MTKKFKKVLASVIAIASLTTGMVGITAFAAYQNFDFYVERGSSGFSSSSARKTTINGSSQDYAIVNPTSGNVSSTMCYLSVYNNLKSFAHSSSLRITSIKENFEIPYTTNLTVHDYYYLKAEAGYYGIELEGSWTP